MHLDIPILVFGIEIREIYTLKFPWFHYIGRPFTKIKIIQPLVHTCGRIEGIVGISDARVHRNFHREL
jgi:hypothetical protein